MTTTYPGSRDTFTNPVAGEYTTSPSHLGQHADANDAIEAIELELDTHKAAADPHPGYLTAAEGAAAFDAAGAAATAASGAASALSAHEADTTSIHGIANTANLYAAGGTDVAVADGGTGASTAGGARTNLGLVIGTDVQAQDAELAALAGLTSAADAFPYFTGSGSAALVTIVSAIRTILAAANAGAFRTAAGLAIGSNVQAWDADLDAIAALTTTSIGRSLLAAADAAALRAILALAASDAVTFGAIGDAARISATLTADVNDWSPAGLSTASEITVSQTGGPWKITGIAAQPAGRRLVIYNGSAGTVTLRNQNGGSSGANQFIGPGNADLVLPVLSAVEVKYSGFGAWLILGY